MAFPRALSMATPTTPEPGEAPHRPSLLAVIKRVSVSLLIAVIVPAVVFYGVFVLAGVWTAIIAALGWPYGAIAWRAVTGRRTSWPADPRRDLADGPDRALGRRGQHVAVLPAAGHQ